MRNSHDERRRWMASCRRGLQRGWIALGLAMVLSQTAQLGTEQQFRSAVGSLSQLLMQAFVAFSGGALVAAFWRQIRTGNAPGTILALARLVACAAGALALRHSALYGLPHSLTVRSDGRFIFLSALAGLIVFLVEQDDEVVSRSVRVLLPTALVTACIGSAALAFLAPPRSGPYAMCLLLAWVLALPLIVGSRILPTPATGPDARPLIARPQDGTERSHFQPPGRSLPADAGNHSPAH